MLLVADKKVVMVMTLHSILLLLNEEDVVEINIIIEMEVQEILEVELVLEEQLGLEL